MELLETIIKFKMLGQRQRENQDIFPTNKVKGKHSILSITEKLLELIKRRKLTAMYMVGIPEKTFILKPVSDKESISLLNDSYLRPQEEDHVRFDPNLEWNRMTYA